MLFRIRYPTILYNDATLFHYYKSKQDEMVLGSSRYKFYKEDGNETSPINAGPEASRHISTCGSSSSTRVDFWPENTRTTSFMGTTCAQSSNVQRGKVSHEARLSALQQIAKCDPIFAITDRHLSFPL